MAVLNDLDRYHPVGDVVDRASKLGYKAAYLNSLFATSLSTINDTLPNMGKTCPRFETDNGLHRIRASWQCSHARTLDGYKNTQQASGQCLIETIFVFFHQEFDSVQ